MPHYIRLIVGSLPLKKLALIAVLALTGFGISGFVSASLGNDEGIAAPDGSGKPANPASGGCGLEAYSRCIYARLNESFGCDNAISDFEGVITYSVTSENPSAAQKSRTLGNTVFYMKGNKIKSVNGAGGSYESSTIFDCNNPDNPVILISVDGHKYNVKNDPADKMPDPLIKYEDGTKTIAGYTCHKAEITIFYNKDKTNSRNEEVYYSADITGSSCGLLFKGLKGIPLEWVTLKSANNPNDITMTTIAISVDKKPVSDDEFKAPPEYKVVTKEEISQDIMNNGSKK